MSYILNEDVLKLILNQLTLRQKLQLERVSKQFQNCVKNVLQQQNQLLIENIFENFDVSAIGENFKKFSQSLQIKKCVKPLTFAY
jgi:hypothetical protein